MTTITDEAIALNWMWDFAVARGRQTGHPYYAMLSSDLRAAVRSYGAAKDVAP